MSFNEESDLFKSITGRNLTPEQLEQLKKLKKLSRDWVSHDTDSSETSDIDFELDTSNSTGIDTPSTSKAFPSNISVQVFDTSRLSPDARQQAINNYINGEISFVEFTDFLERRNATEDSLVENETNLFEEEDSGDDTTPFVDDLRDKNYQPPKSKSKKPKQTVKATAETPKRKPKRKTQINQDFEECHVDAFKQPKRHRRLKSDLPADLQCLVGEANLCVVREDYENAIKMCMEVIRLAPQAPGPFQTLGMIYEEMGDMDKSLQYALVAAYLMPNDSEEWTRLGEMSLERNDIKQAIVCYGKAIRSDPTNVDLMWERCRLYDQIDDQKRVLEQLQQIAKTYKPEEGEMILQVNRDISRRLYNSGQIESAKTTMLDAFNKHSDYITSEDVNLLLELMMKLNLFSESIKILCEFCGVRFEPPLEESTVNDLSISRLTLKDKKCLTPDILPIDLTAKLLICLLHVGALELTSDLILTLLQESPEEMGDLYLDVAEAYMELSLPKEALPLLASLAGSEKYNLPFVWQKYGECQMALGNLAESERIYQHVVELAPSHTAARMVLSGILQQLGRTNESLSVLTTGINDALELDPPLQIQRANLLYAREKWEEFIAAARLLHSAHTVWKNDCPEAASMATCTTGRIRDLFKIWKEEFEDQIQIREDSIHCEEIWDIYKKMCSKMLDLGKLEELEYVTLTAQASTIFTDKPKLKECHFMHLLACYYNRDLDRAYQLIKNYVSSDDSSNRTWNIFNLIVGLLRQLKHNRFCIRLMYKSPDHIQLGIINGHTAFAAGSYKHALGEYMNVFKNIPKDPMIAFCIALTYTHIACQKFTTKKHSVVLQAVAFFNLYRELRGECQETYYNIGRAMHQLGLTYVAVDYYKKALEFPPVVKDNSIYDLRLEIAYNLSFIYSKSGSVDLAKMYIYKYCII